MAASSHRGLRTLCTFAALATAACWRPEASLEEVASSVLLQTESALHHGAFAVERPRTKKDKAKSKAKAKAGLMQTPVELDLQEPAQVHARLSFPDGEGCPTTYIYDIPELWDLNHTLGDVKEQGEQLLDEVWGRPCSDGTFYINQYSMPQIMIYRLMNSQRCKVTTNPEEADLFLVPYRPKAKIGALYCADGGIDPEPFLKHLTPENAHKHMFLLGKGHILLQHCGDWWRYPTGLLSHAIRVTYSLPARFAPGEEHFITPYGPLDSRELTFEKLASLTADFLSDDAEFPHTFSVPYPSTGLLGSQPLNEPWKDSESTRPVLAYFFGGMHGRYGLEIRLKIRDVCLKAGAPNCLYVFADHHNQCEALAQKRKSLFCLEPPGDSPYRKSLFDDLSLGCIPVLFSPYMQLVAPWHWGHWRNESHVYINKDDFMEGKLDLIQVLQDIASSPRLLQMRKSIAANAHSVQYARHDYPGDGVERLLIGAHHAAQSYSQTRQM